MYSKNSIISLTLGICLATTSLYASTQNSKWSYEEIKGPQYWGKLNKNYSMCEKGVNQSPINITNTIDSKLVDIKFLGRSTANNIVNNGHTVQVNFPKGNNIILENNSYDLLQLHFHSPSENKINGVSYPMEAHLVHSDKGGNLAVIAVMFKIANSNEDLKNLFRDIPLHKGDKVSFKNRIIKGYDLLPKNKEYYRFSGSLTTPPCSEGVKWLVMKNSIEVSKEQIALFESTLHGKNNRPIQPIHSRIILK